MPLYEYECQGCEERFELLVRSDTKIVCPACAGTEVEKCLSTFATHVGSSSTPLPQCGVPLPGGGCGLPQCGSGGCMAG